ncbi:MAG TPA: hypothetical protein VE991_12980 [Acidimicrobiales bacterium]|nr:hypothetical protein [Acidimicrobiales bacterium]
MNPTPWPDAVADVVERAVTTEYASLTRAGTPVTVPTTPYLGERADTIDVSTGLTYPAKAERARTDPRVALLLADPVGAPGTPAVLVQGLATVRDSDLQANTDRYVRVSTAKLPDATKGQPKMVLRRMAWYYARIWVEVTPLHIWWWPSRELEAAPSEWHAPDGTSAPLSDPPPPGRRPGAWLSPPAAWEPLARSMAAQGALVDVTAVGANEFPVCLPAHATAVSSDGIHLRLGPGALALSDGPACLTMHLHDERFTGQENHSFVGTLTSLDTGLLFRVERVLPDWSLAGNKARVAVGFLAKGRILQRRLAAEAARRGQPVPKVRFPARASSSAAS